MVTERERVSACPWCLSQALKERPQPGWATAHVTIETHVRVGHAVPVITNFIERERFDLLVIGYMGHSALYNRLIGSTTDRLVELAPCQVLVVK